MGIFDGVMAAVAGPLVREMFDDEGPSFAQQADFAREQASTNAALQREFAQHGVRWRVEDAKAAGLHPMYALTGGGAAFAPNPIVMPGHFPSQSGKNFGDAAQGALAAFFKSQEKKDEVLSAAVQAVRALAESNSISSAPAPEDYRWDMDMSGGPMHGTVNLQNLVDVQDYRPAQVLSRRSEDPSVTPGTGPAFSMHQVRPGFQMLLPSSQGGGTSEALEALSESMELTQAVLQRNVDEFGPEWLDQASRYFPISGTIAKVINNIRNGYSWVEPTWDALGHAHGRWLQERQDNWRENYLLRKRQDRRMSERFRERNPQFFRR